MSAEQSSAPLIRQMSPAVGESLGDRRRVAPAHVGLAWLLDLARSTDTELAGFAQRMLLGTSRRTAPRAQPRLAA